MNLRLFIELYLSIFVDKGKIKGVLYKHILNAIYFINYIYEENLKDTQKGIRKGIENQINSPQIYTERFP